MKPRYLFALACLALAACSTPFSPPVLVKDSPPFHGLADMLGSQPLDVVLIHGMCTHDEAWAHTAMERLAAAVDSRVAVQLGGERKLTTAGAAAPGILLVPGQAVIDGQMLRMTGIVWSPLTASLKGRLDYDKTGEPTDCVKDAKCKPKRALLNGELKDGLLDDCLADALIYEGDSRAAIRSAMVDALGQVFENSAPGSRMVLISDSLGSKIAYDALAQMLLDKSSVALAAMPRLGQVFMNANQLPLLGLADPPNQFCPVPEDPAAKAPLSQADLQGDSLQRLLQLLPPSMLKREDAGPALTIVAFTDPNDLLSYRLRPTCYARPGVVVSDLLVSNRPTYLGLIERPDTAHAEYTSNNDVWNAVACGFPGKSARCK